MLYSLKSCKTPFCRRNRGHVAASLTDVSACSSYPDVSCAIPDRHEWAMRLIKGISGREDAPSVGEFD
jgi:hypothetical protein